MYHLSFLALSSSISNTISEVGKTSSDLDSLLNSSDIDDSTKTTLSTLQTLLSALSLTLSSYLNTLSSSTARLYRNTKGKETSLKWLTVVILLKWQDCSAVWQFVLILQ